MYKRRKHLYEFGSFTLDAANRLLLRGGEPVPLHPKAFDTLLLLVEHRGEVLEKEYLIGRLWPDSFVEESNLAQNVYVLRKVLGQGEGGGEYIKTVPKRGYQFVADVREEADPMEGGKSQPLAAAEEAVEAAPVAGGARTEQATRGAMPAVAPPAWSGTGRSISLMLAAGGLAFGLLIGAYIWFTSRAKQPVTTAVKSIAVLPFKPLVSDNRNESLEMGIADTLIFRLSGIRGVIVRPLSAVRKYADLHQDPLAAGREQQVDAVLDSGVQTVGQNIRVTARLVRVEDGSVLWADKFEDKFTDIFAVQDSIAEKVTGALALKLTSEEQQRLTRRYTDNTEAYQLYLKGRYFFNKRTLAGFNKGIEYFQQAIEKDPAYALAYAGLSDCHTQLGAWQILPPNETFPKARAEAEKALQIDDSLAEAHTSLARVKSLSGDWPGAEAEYKRAIELNPNYEEAHRWHGFHLAEVGRLDEAMAETRRAQKLDPLSLPTNTQMGRIFYLMRQYDQAIAQYQKTLEMDPNFAQAHFLLGWAYEQKGMYDEAISEYPKDITLRGRPTFVSRIGRAYALSGKRREAQKVLDELKALSKQSYVPAYHFALLYDGLGEKEQGIAWLEKAYEEGGSNNLGLKADPTWDSLRSHPRFQDLLRRVGFEP